jgi:predicted GNAT family acetyltransferase
MRKNAALRGGARHFLAITSIRQHVKEAQRIRLGFRLIPVYRIGSGYLELGRP